VGIVVTSSNFGPMKVGEVYSHLEEVKTSLLDYAPFSTGAFPTDFRVQSVPSGIPCKRTYVEGFRICLRHGTSIGEKAD